MDNQQILDDFYRMRQRARTDLLWLANEVLGYRDVNREEHGPILDALQKFQGGEELFDGVGEWVGYRPFVSLWDMEGPRNALLIYPRGTYKTSCAIAHDIQWIVNYPDVRGLISMATGTQVQETIQAILGHFRFNNMFRWLFAEFCPPARTAKDFGSNEGFTVPNRKLKWLREPTISTCSIGKVMSGNHYEFINHSDVVDKENVKTPFQIQEVKNHFGYCNFLLHRAGEPVRAGWQFIEGTFYDFCLAGETRILMSNWSHKKISEIAVGDVVVGWKLVPGKKRMLVKSKVLACGNFLGKVNRYTFESGTAIICTPEHRWWKGKGWDKNNISKEYLPLWTGNGRARLKRLCRLLRPSETIDSWESGWLAGLYDGEGSFRKNPNHPSGTITITQTMHNPVVIEKTRQALKTLGFQWSEIWHDPKLKTAAGGDYQKRCQFAINGGWKERYKFLVEISPFRSEKIAASLFGAFTSDEDKLVSVEDAGLRQVFWFQSETGNYFAEGYASKNSDFYMESVDKHSEDPDWKIVVRPPYKEDGSLAFPKTLPKQELERIEKQPGMTPFLYSTQILLKPVPQGSGLATREEVEKLFVPRKFINAILPMLRLHATVDLAGMEQTLTGDYSVLNVSGFDRDGRCYGVDLWHSRFSPDEVIDLIFLIYSRYPRILDIKIEKDAHARVLAAFLRREMAKRQKFPPVVAIPRDSRQSKKDRIRGLQPWFRNGMIRFAEDLVPKLELIQEVTRFSTTSTYHDDILDTYADQMQNQDGGVAGDVIPDEPRWDGKPMMRQAVPKFLGFDHQGQAQWSGHGAEEHTYDRHTGL